MGVRRSNARGEIGCSKPVQPGRWAFHGTSCVEACALAPRIYAGEREMPVCAEFNPLLSESVLFDAFMFRKEHDGKWRRCWFMKFKSLCRGYVLPFSADEAGLAKAAFYLALPADLLDPL